MIYTKHIDFRIALVETCDRIAKSQYRFTPFLVVQYVGRQKAYYIFSKRVKG